MLVHAIIHRYRNGVIAGCISPHPGFDGAKPIMWIELPVFTLLLIFLALEVYAEQRQLIFQALLFQVSEPAIGAVDLLFAVPTASPVLQSYA